MSKEVERLRTELTGATQRADTLEEMLSAERTVSEQRKAIAEEEARLRRAAEEHIKTLEGRIDEYATKLGDYELVFGRVQAVRDDATRVLSIVEANTTLDDDGDFQAVGRIAKAVLGRA